MLSYLFLGTYSENEENAAKESSSIDPTMTRPGQETSPPQPVVRSHSNSDPPAVPPGLPSGQEVELNSFVAAAGSPVPRYPPPPVRHTHVRSGSTFSFQSTDSSLLNMQQPSLQSTPSTVQDFIRTHRRTGSHNSFFHRQVHPELIALNTRHADMDGLNETGTQIRHRRTGSNVSYYSRQSMDSSLLSLQQGEPQSVGGDQHAKTKVHGGNTYRQLLNQDDNIQLQGRVFRSVTLVTMDNIMSYW